MVLKKLRPFEGVLTEYTGHYYSEELEYELILTAQDSVIIANHNYINSTIPISNSIFYDTGSRTIMTFSRDESGQIEGLHLDIPLGDRSLRKMRFERVGS